MSWWNKNFSDLASQALKNAQKKIDKVLDIDEEATGTKPVSKVESKECSSNEAATSGRSSWSMPWGSSYYEESSSSFTNTDSKESSETKTELPKTDKEDDSKRKLKRESSGSSLKQKSRKSTIGQKYEKQKSSDGIKIEPVSDFPDIKSQEKVDNWDISSGWKEDIHDLEPSKIDQKDAKTLDPVLTSSKDYESQTLYISSDTGPDLSKAGSDLETCSLDQSDNQASISKVVPETSSVHIDEPCDVLPTGETGTPETVTVSETHEKNTESDTSELVTQSDSAESQGNNCNEITNISETLQTVSLDNTSVLESECSVNVAETPQNVDLNVDKNIIEEPPAIDSNVDKDVIEEPPTIDFNVDKDVIEEPPNIGLNVNENIAEEPQNIDLNVDKNTTEDVNDVADTEETSSSVEVIPSSDNTGSSSTPVSDEPNQMGTKDSDMGASSGSGDSVEDTGGSAGQGPPLSPSASSSVCSSDTNKLDSSMDTQTSEETVVDKAPAEEEEEEEDDTKKGDESGDTQEEGKNNDSIYSVSSSSSYVKCMIEEAMEDNSKVEDSNSDHDCHSLGGEKSECSRSTGGHESGDEIDTTTSSDIEIISTPNSNGDGNKIVDLSPLKIALQKTARRGSPTHRRTDSQSSSSTQSRDGQGEQLSPGRDSLEDDGHYAAERKSSLEEHRLEPVSEEYRGDPYSNPQKLLKKMSEMAEVIQAREQKLVQLSKENNDLLEANNILRNQLQQAEEAREVELEDMNKVSAEFTKRIGDADKKANTVIKERDAIKKQMQNMQDDYDKKLRNIELELEEKNQQISELLQEGEKLSKQQLQVNNITKKLRAKEKENDSLLTSQKKKLEEQKTELEHLRNVCESKDVMEKKQSEAINQLNSAVQKQERDIAKLKGESEDAQERVRGLQAALDNSYKEIAELNKSNAAQDSRAQETALSVEVRVREELRLSLEKEQHSYKQEREALIMQIEDLRLSMSRQEKEHNRREDLLRQEISDLQMQLQEDEARNQDVTHSVTSATRPLLRQIENLQSTFAAQSSAWDKLERNLTDRLTECQSQLAMAVERERSASEKLLDLNTQMKTYESQNSQLRQDKSHLTAQLEMVKSKVQVLEDAKNNESAQIEVIKQQMSHDLHEIRKEKVFLETQLDMERTKVQQEQKKLSFAQDQIVTLEREAQRPISRGSASPQPLSRPDSVPGESSLNTSFNQDDIEKTFMLSPGSLGNRTNLYEALRQSGAVNVLENLQSQLKLREGEIIQLQSDIQQLERTRESMARELVNLTNQNEELTLKVEELPSLNQQLQDINLRYNSLLQMYGEKVEEAEELRMDLTDVKDMYKMQIDHLLAK